MSGARIVKVALGATAVAALLCVASGSAFCAPQGLQLSAPQAATAQRSQAPAFAPLEESTGTFVESAPAFSLSACVGAALVLSAVAVFSNPGRRYRRVWRRKVRSQWFGRKAARTDQRPELFIGVKDPQAPKKIYHYYCNKMYKVIREAAAQEVATIEEKEEQFIKPAVWNTPWFRATTLMLGGAAAGGVLPFASALHLFAYGTWLGTNVWTTFVAGLTMFKNLPRQEFGKLQAVLFPKYFQLGTACSAAVIFTGQRMGLPLGPMIMSLVCTLANQLYLEPKATEVMFERYDRTNKGLKDPTIDKALGAKFGKLHGASSLANLLALIGLVAHGVLIAARL